MNWSNLKNTENSEIKVTRLIQATPEFVFNLYSTPDHVDRWWGPKGFTNRTTYMDFQEGGIWDHVMIGPDGTEYDNRTIYKEIIRPSKIIYTNSAPGDEANEFLTIINFEKVGDKTKLTVHMIFQTVEHYNNAIGFGADPGLHDTVDKLVDYVTNIMGGQSE